MAVRAVIVGLCVLAVAACEIRIASQRADDVVDPACGNLVVDPGEVCDDGNSSDGDGCSADCKSDESCGNGVVDIAMDETCDDGDQRGGDGCSADCKSDETCGNGVLDMAKGETCDDGNLVPLDGCSANCQSNEQCGNGQVDTVTSNGVPEQCDTAGASLSCDVDCTFASCGDGTVNMAANEECDDGNGNNGDQCDNQCRDVVCGNGTTEGNEQCDDGNGTTTDACVGCKTAFCGDGFTQTGVEQCDDSDNGNVNDACTVNCQAAFCGDGFLRTGVEQCEDGNTDNGDGCDSNCQFEPRTYVLNESNCDPGTQTCTSSQLIGFFSDCSDFDLTGSPLTNPYDGCSGGATGWQWFDTAPFFPSQIVMEVNHGITCNGGIDTASTTINGVLSGDFTLQNPGGCNCRPQEVLNSWTFTGGQLDGFVPGQQNTLMIAGMPNCMGLSFDDNMGGYVRITVFP